MNRPGRCGFRSSCFGRSCGRYRFNRLSRLRIDFIQDVFGNRRQGFYVFLERTAQDFFDGQAVIAEREQAGIDHVVKQRRIFQVIGSDDCPLSPAAAENSRIGKVFL